MKNIYAIAFLFLAACYSEDFPDDLPIVFIRPVNDINEEGVKFEALVMTKGNNKIGSFGFIWSYEEGNQVHSFYDTLIGPWGANTYSTQVTYGLLKGKEYSVKFFTITDNRTVFSNEQKFISEGGLPPIISNVSPTMGFDGDEFEINGNNFFTDKKYVQVFVDGKPAEIKSTSLTLIKAIIPDLAISGFVDVKIIVDHQNVVLFNALKIYSPSILSISASEGRVGDFIEIHGENLALPNVKTIIYIDGYGDFEPEIATSNFVRLRVPQYYMAPTPTGPNEVQVDLSVGLVKTQLGSTIRLSNSIPFKILNSWNEVISGIPIIDGLGITIGEVSYWVGARQDFNDFPDQIWSFNPTNKQWSYVTNLPFENASSWCVAATEDKIYVILSGTTYGLYSVWEYNLITNEWNLVIDYFPSSDIPRSVCVIGSKIYIISSTWMYSYDLETNQLTTDLLTPQMYGSMKFMKVNSKAFLIRTYLNIFTVFEFRPDTGTWEILQTTFSYPIPAAFRSFSGSSLGGISNNSIFYTYDPNHIFQWRMNQFLPYVDGLSGTLIGNYLYVIGFKECCEASLFSIDVSN